MYCDHRDLHSFPTRRSSDLRGRPGFLRSFPVRGTEEPAVEWEHPMKLPLASLFAAALLAAASGNDGDWPVYGHDSGGTKYSPLDQINRQNVTRLQAAWTFHTGDMYDPKGRGGKKSAFESTPLFIDGVLYVTTPFGRLIALDPAT